MTLPWNVEVVETIDDRWMVLVNGFQWGPDFTRYDASGANDETWETAGEARDTYRQYLAHVERNA